MSKKHKRVFVLNYIQRSLILISAVTRCVSISDDASLNGIPLGIARSAAGLKIYARTVGIRKYKSIIKKREKSMIK